ncbi:hypothetical protein [Aurantiacibacter arachoides]|nr:hypothetical protein [Aurantiacibacter arachoides]GGD52259.1 hypothetical protein GCM10011411_10150 [Aurantiacibacter arachoides]
MDSSIITIIIALVLVFIAWKFLKGIIKTVALVAILIVAALFVFGGGMG